MLNDYDFSLYKTLDGNEDLPNFYDTFTFSQAKI